MNKWHTWPPVRKPKYKMMNHCIFPIQSQVWFVVLSKHHRHFSFPWKVRIAITIYKSLNGACIVIHDLNMLYFLVLYNYVRSERTAQHFYIAFLVCATTLRHLIPFKRLKYYALFVVCPISMSSYNSPSTWLVVQNGWFSVRIIYISSYLFCLPFIYNVQMRLSINNSKSCRPFRSEYVEIHFKSKLNIQRVLYSVVK